MFLGNWYSGHEPLKHARKKRPLIYILVVLAKQNHQVLAISIDCFLIKQLFHLRVLDMKRLYPIILSQTRAYGIIVKYIQFSMITHVIIEILFIWLVEDCVISFYNNLTWDYRSGSSNFQNGRLAICWRFWGRSKKDNRKCNFERH